MNVPGTLFLAANTARSQTYAQAMDEYDLRVDTTLYLDGNVNNEPRIEIDEHRDANPSRDIFFPDLSIPLIETCRKISDSVQTIHADHVNDAKILADLEPMTPKPGLVIYSGYGGQIVSSRLLDIGMPFLHVHSGWLPAYRGSTTVYYSLLREGRCGVSAFYLAPKIDEGPVVDRRWYPAPPDRKVDFLYDNAIRADLLVKVLKRWHDDNDLPIIEQDPDEAMTYYVIHPVLKHLALLSLSSEPAS